MKNLINCYVRVSSQEQGDSRLGIDAQIKALTDYANANDLVIQNTYIDVKSGKDMNRPELNKCIENCLSNTLPLYVAKSCRLSRDIEQGFKLRKQGINIVILDTNINNTMEYGIKMLFNQQEREEISRRTRLALAQLKSRGIELGKAENFTNESRKLGREAMSQNAKNDLKNIQATNLILIYKENNKSFSEIAKKLNELGMKTRRDKEFTSMQIKRLYDRATANKES